MTSETFSERLSQIRDRITIAARRVGRSPEQIVLIAVSKKQPVRLVEAAVNAGLLDFGENYVQEASDKRSTLAHSHCCWHLIGHLQSNKVKLAVETFDLIQSVDSIRVARQIAKHAQAQSKTQRILLQVHLGQEVTKTGFSSDCVAEAAHEIFGTPGIELQGLMGIAPQHEAARPHFRHLRRSFETLPLAAQTVLSMGMTSDFETAIEEGATMIRVGTALFGARAAAEVTGTPDN